MGRENSEAARGHVMQWARGGPDAGAAAGLVYVGDAIREAAANLGNELDGLRDEIHNMRMDVDARAEQVENELIDLRKAVERYGS